ncbi:hypothetical protein BK120_23125 [Paenibacillus sp. FSL A5-0031]|uniref:hypothetical protein n=1 Tax=Paenibacillus sp. FSL A5-0031 TaxID=1920420 RepID=UPI00096DB418|nr:hypothetical protein [Paenibacillus sp. FSL A5-0031]OME78634.1 hypothetical protein BK120_23125 [Paenibacillus sp. FSL A5-0031]
MTTHFGIKLRNREGGFKLTVDNYVKMSDKDTATLSEELKLKSEKVMTRFDLNMRYFKSLAWDKFNEELSKFVTSNNFYEINDLNYVEDIAGHYVMVLDEYCQIYIGTSSRGHGIKGRIPQHWRKQISLDQLRGEDSGSLAIGSFRPLDTTRIFVCPDDEYNFFEDYTLNECFEGRLVAKFPVDYCSNQSMVHIPKEYFFERLRERDLRDLKVYTKSH